jgi:hypothetical protein
LTPLEKRNMITLSCLDKVAGNPLFGPNLIIKTPNFKLVIAKCPTGCYKPSKVGVYGTGIHTEDSSICQAAIVDGSMPPTG